jgi:hypothetical protein
MTVSLSASKIKNKEKLLPANSTLHTSLTYTYAYKNTYK